MSEDHDIGLQMVAEYKQRLQQKIMRAVAGILVVGGLVMIICGVRVR